MKLLPRSLPIRLSIYICLLLMLFVVVAMSIIGFLWYRGLATMLDDHARTVTREMAHSLDRIFVQAEQSAQIFAMAIEKCDCSQGEIHKFVASVLPLVNQRCPDVRGITLAWREGYTGTSAKTSLLTCYERNGQYSVQIHDGRSDYLYKDWFIIPTTLGRPVWTIPYFDKDGLKTLLVSYAIPFYRAEGTGKRTLIGVVEVDICINDLEKYLSENRIVGLLRLSSKSRAFVMNQFGQIVIDPINSDFLSKTIFSLCDEPEEPDPQDREEAKRIFRNETGRVHMKKAPILDVSSQLYFAHCVNGWVVSVAVPGDWMNSYLRPIFIRFMLAWLFAIATIVSVVFFICRRVNRPLLALSDAAEAVGHGDFTRPLPAVVFDDELGRVTQSFGRMQSELSDYIEQMRQTVTARERAEGELNAAAQIQQGILPRHLPPFDGFERVRASASLHAARGVGGDLYDIFPLDPNRLAIIVGDVSGKGIPAALFMAVTETLQRSLARTAPDPALLATKLNAALALNNDATMFVTWWVAFLEVDSGAITFSNAGHNPPLIKRANGTVERLDQRHGLPLAAVDDLTYRSSQTTLDEGDLLLLYTDGVTEAFNMANEMFGETRLINLVKESSAQTPEQLREELSRAVSEFAANAPQSDDITILCVQYGQEPHEIRQLALEATIENLAKVMAFVEEEPGTNRLTPKSLNQLMVCIEEIFANIVHYACPGKLITVSTRVDQELNQVRVRFADSGPPFNPLEQAEPDLTLPASERPIGGLGIFIVRKWMDEVSYRREDDTNILLIAKRLDASPADSC